MKNTSEKSYKIGDAARMLDLEPYVLRFWENEFPQLNPVRTSKGQRLYTEEHLSLIRRIKYLLYDQGMTIEGARRKLDEYDQWLRLLDEVKTSIQEIKDILESK